MCWDEGAVDPVEDIKKAIAKLKEPDSNHFRKMAELEELAQEAARLLIESGATPEEVEQEFMKAGVWPRVIDSDQEADAAEAVLEQIRKA
jgi:hypothetical protein